jgi:hypothetical protein
MNTETMEKKSARLLIANYDSIDDIKRKILDSQYTAFDLDKPTLRFRGTIVDARCGMENIRIIAWQRNVARLRKMDVSLPTIVFITLGRNRSIESIELDPSFAGSKGLMCCFTYLNRNLKSRLVNQPFDGAFLKLAKQEKLHCAHLFEVLSCAYSFFRILEENDFNDLKARGYAYEEEVIDSYAEKATLHSVGRHAIGNKLEFDYRLDLADIISGVRFAKSGALETARAVEASFSINDKQVLSDPVSVNSAGSHDTDLSAFLIRCIGALRKEMFPAKQTKMLNTNLYPRAYIGMLVQSVAIRLFNSNYNYIMHALTALQRTNNAPLCAGALADQEEADKFFPGYSFSELV